MGLLLLIILLLLLFGAFPREGYYNSGWGYGPSGLVFVLLVVLLFLLLAGRGPVVWL